MALPLLSGDGARVEGSAPSQKEALMTNVASFSTNRFHSQSIRTDTVVCGNQEDKTTAAKE